MSCLFDNILAQMSRIRPRVHCLTNPVTMQDVANILLAAGGSAIMAQEPAEAAEITAICQAVLLNTGVPDAEKMRACVISGERANELGIPVVLDPVGAGASAFRLRELEKLTHSVRMALIRCNQEEAKALLPYLEWSLRRRGERCDGERGGTDRSGPEADGGISVRGSGERAKRCGGGGRQGRSPDRRRCEIVPDYRRRLYAVSPLRAAVRSRGGSLGGSRTAGALWRSCAEWADRESRKTSGGIGTFHMRLFDAVERYFYRSTEGK